MAGVSRLKTYCDRVPKENQWKLDKQIDFEHDGVQAHLGVIADAMDEWEGRVAEALGLDRVSISSIKAKHTDNLNLQTREALHLWRERNGLDASYRKLIGAFLEAEKTTYAEAVCKVLGAKLGDMKVSESATSDIDESSAIAAVACSSTGSTEVAPKKCYVKKVEMVLKENEAKIQRLFAGLVRQVLSILNKREIDKKEFRVYVVQLFSPSWCIPKSEDMFAIFEAISSNLLWSYSHFSPLESIAEEFAKDDTHSLMESYKMDLSSFYTTTDIVDYIALCQDDENVVDPDVPLAANPAKYNGEYFQKLTVRLDRPVTNETLQYIADIWRAIAKFFLLPALTALLDRIVEGSLVISWFIPHIFAMQIRVNSSGDEAEAFFRAHQITEVKLDGDCLYMCDTKANDIKLALLTACEKAIYDQVLDLLEALPDFDFSKYADTPLGIAAEHGSIDIVQLLLLYGFDVNGRNKDGWTALMEASFSGRADVVELLLEHNADINEWNKRCWTALMMASSKGRTDVVELLIKHKADVNARREDGLTALMAASQDGRTDVVDLLIKHNADVNARRRDNTTALVAASFKGRTDVVELLIKHNADVNAKNKSSWTALMEASLKGRTDVVELLIKHSADVNAKNKDGLTALMVASQEGRTDVIELLIIHNADVNAKKENGWTALMAASSKGRTDVVKLLIQHNADVNARKENGITALVIASLKGNVEVVKALLDANADLNIAENETNWTPLFFASKEGHAEIVRLLVEHGVDVDYKDKNGVTAYDIARTHNYPEVSDLLAGYSKPKEQVTLNEDTRKHVLRTETHLQNVFDQQVSAADNFSEKKLEREKQGTTRQPVESGTLMQ